VKPGTTESLPGFIAPPELEPKATVNQDPWTKVH